MTLLVATLSQIENHNSRAIHTNKDHYNDNDVSIHTDER